MNRVYWYDEDGKARSATPVVSPPEPCPTCADCPSCHGRRVLPPEKVCASETCRKPFRWQEGGAEKGQNRSKGVLYCSPLCARAQSQRMSRRRRAS